MEISVEVRRVPFFSSMSNVASGTYKKERALQLFHVKRCAQTLFSRQTVRPDPIKEKVLQLRASICTSH